MIYNESYINPAVAGWLFLEFASKFPQKYIVIIQSYADEAGTHDKTGQQKGAAVPIVAGYFASVEQWAVFSRDWQRVLNEFTAPYFHHKEFGFHQRKKIKNPYRTWSEKKIDSFYYELAMVAAGGLIPLGGMYWAQEHHKQGMEGDAHENAMIMFFNAFCEQINLLKTVNVEKILFIFDNNEKKEWKRSLCKTFSRFKKLNPNFRKFSFEDDKNPLHLGLQAADLYAACCHKRSLDFMVGGKGNHKARIIDLILNRFSPKKDPANALLENMPEAAFRMMIDTFREDEQRQKKEWERKGLKQDYYPESHFPFELWKQNHQKRLLKTLNGLRRK